jgi:hypothetical protein
VLVVLVVVVVVVVVGGKQRIKQISTGTHARPLAPVHTGSTYSTGGKSGTASKPPAFAANDDAAKAVDAKIEVTFLIIFDSNFYGNSSQFLTLAVIQI